MDFRLRLLSWLLVALVAFHSSHARSENCRLIRAAPESVLLECLRLSVLYLHGTPLERAREYGRHLQEKRLDPELVHYFANRLLYELNDLPRPLRWLADKIYSWWAGREFRATDPAARDEIAALAAGMGVDAAYLQRATLLADLSSRLNAHAESWPLKHLPPFGCTSVAKRAADGSFHYGRNLDFASTGIWDKRPLVLVHVPPQGSKEIVHAAFGAHGVYHSGITGVNASGITFAVHQNFSDLSASGVPMPLIGETVLREANTLDEAIALLDKSRPGPIWTFVVTDLKTGEAAAVESGASVFHVRRMSGSDFAQTNHLAGETTHPREYARPALLENSRFRFDQALKLLHTDPETNFTPETIFRILATQADHRGEINGYADILKPLTIQSLVFQTKPGEDVASTRVHISAGDAPTATGLFLEFRLGDLLRPANELQLAFDGRPAILPDSEIRKNQMAAARAERLYFDERNPAAAVKEVENQNSLGARLFRATAYYELGQYDNALTTASAALSDPALAQAPLRVRDGLHRPLLLSLVALGKTAEAKAAAEAVLKQGTDDSALLETTRLVRDGKKIPYRLRKISYDFFSGNIRTCPERAP